MADNGNLIHCLELAVRMKAQDVKPDVLTYHCLIRACGKDGLTKHAAAIFEDMLAAGLQPERETFHLLFKVSLLARIDLGVFADHRTGPFA
jgi:pentatricopeptide repeat protein